MVILRVRRLMLENEARSLDRIRSVVPSIYKSLIRPSLEAQAEVLGINASALRSTRASSRLRAATDAPALIDAEVFTDGQALFVFALRFSRNIAHTRARNEQPPIELRVAYIGADPECPGIEAMEAAVTTVFEKKLEPYWYPSSRFRELQSDGRQPADAPTSEQLTGARALSDRDVRTALVAIRTAGGLLVRDLSRQLPATSRERGPEIRSKLEAAGLVDSEVVIVCNKTHEQTVRAVSRQSLMDLAGSGIRCACGSPLSDEGIEEALTVAPLGHSLLDKSSWLTTLLLEELLRIGIPLDHVLVEQQIGGDEIDCIANISGERVLFELKDKEFNLGSAYSFGAKVGIIQPQHPVIFSTEHVGGDARDHFQRARQAQSQNRYTNWDGTAQAVPGMTYIEGIGSLGEGVRNLASRIYASDAAELLDSAFALVAPNATTVLRALEQRRNEELSSPTPAPAPD